MSDFSTQTQKMRTTAEAVTEAGDQFTEVVQPNFESARLTGSDWPLITDWVGLRQKYYEAYDVGQDAVSAVTAAMTAIGGKLMEVTSAYEHLEETNSLPPAP